MDSVWPCSSGSSARTGLSVSRLGLGTMTWGRDTDEHEAREQLVAFVEAGGTLRRHGRGLHRRRLRAADRLPHRRRLRARRDRAGHQGRHRPAQGRAVHQRLPRPPGQLARRVAGAARRRPRRPVAGAHLGRRRAARGDAERPRLRRDERPGGVRRRQQLQRLAVRPGGHLAARRARAGRRWRPTRSSTPCSTGPSRRRRSRPRRHSASASCPWSPLGRGVLTGKYRSGTPADSRAASPHFSTFVGRYLDEFSQRVVEAVARAADGLGWSSLEVALAWVRDRPGRDRADHRRPHRRPAARVAHRRGVRAARRDHHGPRRRVRRPAGGRA